MIYVLALKFLLSIVIYLYKLNDICISSFNIERLKKYISFDIPLIFSLYLLNLVGKTPFLRAL